jgi:hypothetical protein
LCEERRFRSSCILQRLHGAWVLVVMMVPQAGKRRHGKQLQQHQVGKVANGLEKCIPNWKRQTARPGQPSHSSGRTWQAAHKLGERAAGSSTV